MSKRLVPILVCDGCGTEITVDFYITRQPGNQKVIQRDRHALPERHFCCAACEGWWDAQFPPQGPWGPAWDERDWWCEHVGPCAERARVRTVHKEEPLVDLEFHDRDPEPIG
ncbi:MAG: hypothetical protein HPY64_13060 [Anaerolineae bacterium]|nr:hypothetical protein [Anaerolineae bacterium]